MLRRVLVASLPWVLVARVTTQQCTGSVCVPLPDLPASVKELGQYYRQDTCETVRVALAEAWRQLHDEVNRDTPPKPDRLELVATFACQPGDGTAPPEEGH
jgi:hypothetical protein